MKYIKLLVLATFALHLSACGMEQVDEGYRGIETKWGKVQGEALPPGLYFYNPISTSIFEMPVKEEKVAIETQAFTKDTQTVTIQGTVTYYPDPKEIHNIYSQFGRDWDEKIIAPAILGSIKDSVGQYVADDLVGKREAVKQAAQKEITAALAERKVTVTRLDITNLDFDDAYEKAVEAKVVATQEAQMAVNETVKIKEQAKQTVETAKAQAESMRIQSQALSQNKGLVEYELAKKWNGVLPASIGLGGTVPMIDINKLTR